MVLDGLRKNDKGECMYLIIFFIWVILFPVISVAQEQFNFNIFAGSGGEMDDLQIHFILTDPLGRRTGYLPINWEKPDFSNPANLKEIPGAFYSVERLGDEESGDFGSGESIQFYSHPIVVGTYTITVFAFTDTNYHIDFEEYVTIDNKVSTEFEGFTSSNTTLQYSVFIDPTKPVPAKPVVTKVVTFQTLRDDLIVAQKLNQIGDDKFVNSLIRMVNIAEKLYNKCQQIKDDSKQDKHKRLCYRPVVMILELIKKRLEIVNRICDNPGECKSKCKLKDECDEERAFDNFRKENIKEEGIKEFFSEWDKDEWHKHKKMCKRFVTDEALKIISEDIDWLIKSFSVEKDKLKDKLDKDDVKDLKSEK